MVVDLVEGFGCKESEFSLDGLANLVTASGQARTPMRLVDRGEIVNFNIIFKADKATVVPAPGAVYAACEIASEKEADAWLLLGSDDGAKVWLNGGLLHAFRGPRNMTELDDAIRLPLKRGRNLLLVKVANVAGRWEMTARLEPTASSAIRSVLSRPDGFLRHLLSPEGQSLELLGRGLWGSTTVEVTVEMRDGHRTQRAATTPQGRIPLEGLARGLYDIKLSF